MNIAAHRLGADATLLGFAETSVDGGPIHAVEPGVDVFGAGGLEVEEVGVLVDVEGEDELAVPLRERVLGVADEVEDPLLVTVVREVSPAAAGDAGRLDILGPILI